MPRPRMRYALRQRRCVREVKQIRGTEVSPGYVATDFSQSIIDPNVPAQIDRRKAAFAIPPEAIARAIAYAIEQPDDV